MKPGLSLRRGKTLTDAERLAAVNDWTQEPAIDVARRVEAAPPEPQVPITPAAPAAAPVAPQATDGKTGEVMPWEGVTGSRMSTYRLPERTYLKLKWLGETTYGSSATKILCDILEPELDRMLRERGIEP